MQFFWVFFQNCILSILYGVVVDITYNTKDLKRSEDHWGSS